MRSMRNFIIGLLVALLPLSAFAAAPVVYTPGQQIITSSTIASTAYMPIQQGPQVAAISVPQLKVYMNSGGTAGAGSFTTLNVSGATVTTSTVTSTYTSASATPGTVRDIYGKAVVGSGLTMTDGNLVGVRGEFNLPSGTTVNGTTYLYGIQGKFVGGGTMVASANICGVCAQIDASSGTYTSGVLSGLWIDMGASASASAQSTSFGGASQLLRMTNTTNAGAAKTTSIIDIYANSPLFLTLGGPAATVDYFLTAGTGGSSCGASGGAVAAKVLAITVNGTAYYIPLCSSNS